jgi:hypothetical protein
VPKKWEIKYSATPGMGLPHLVLPWAKDKTLRESGIVYYLERRDGALKIGCTVNYPQRRQTLVYRHGPLLLVAWEIGYYAVEEQRHEQFAQLRIDPAAEWFEVDADLYDHVLMLKALLS